MQMNNNGISIIIPVFNKWELTAACLRSLRKHAPESAFEVLVIDNASQDATAERLAPLGKELFPESFTLIRNAENKNFAGACNQGASASRCGLLFFLNNDTLLTPGWDTPLTRALCEDPALAAVGPLLLYGDGTVQHLGAAVYPDRSIHHFYQGIPGGHPLARKRRQLNFITAAALLIRKEAFLRAGAFYEGYSNGLEDVELCYRLRRLGFSLAVVPESTVYHLEGQPRGTAPAPARNAPVLRQRCPDLRQPEFHHIALADGYVPFFGLFFETFLRPAPERVETFSEAAFQADETALGRVLEQEIFWREGYQTLAGIREQSGKPDEALALLCACSQWYPAVEILESVVRLAQKTGNVRLTREYAHLLEQARATLRDTHFFRVRFQTITETAKALEDDVLAKMIKLWRKTYGKTMPEIFA